MKITAVTTTLLTGPSTNDRFLREARRLRSAAFIEIHTDAGVTGIGETYAGYFCPEAISGGRQILCNWMKPSGFISRVFWATTNISDF